MFDLLDSITIPKTEMKLTLKFKELYKKFRLLNTTIKLS